MTQPTLLTERLRLVPLNDSHLDLEIELDSDPEVMRYLTGRASTRFEVERAHQRRLSAAREVPGLGFWIGFTGDQFIGWWILQPPHGPDQPKVPGEADLGYRLLRRYWRRGYASEGARELVRYGFEQLGLDRIFAQTMASNTASRATLSACGLRFVRGFISGDPYDELVPGADQGEVEYEITRSGWLHEAQLHRKPPCGHNMPVPVMERDGDISVLSLITTAVAADDTRAQRAERAAAAIRAATAVRWVGIYTVADGVVSNEAWSGPAAPAHPSFPADQGLTAHAITVRAAVVCNDVANDPRYLRNQGDTGSELIVPVVIDDRVVGTLDLEHERTDAFDATCIARYQALARALRALWR